MDSPSMHARLRAGDPDAFREFFAAHAQLVYGYAARATGDLSLAEDVVSLTFLEAWRLRGRLRDEGDSPRPWLMGIAVNMVRNTTRARRRYARALARVPPREPLPDLADEVVGRMADEERLAAARRALGKLRSAHREVFMLCVWSGLGYEEAATALGVRVGTVRSRLSRARDRLRRLTEEELGRPEPPGGRGQVGGDRRPSAVRSNQEGRR